MKQFALKTGKSETRKKCNLQEECLRKEKRNISEDGQWFTPDCKKKDNNTAWNNLAKLQISSTNLFENWKKTVNDKEQEIWEDLHFELKELTS